LTDVRCLLQTRATMIRNLHSVAAITMPAPHKRVWLCVAAVVVEETS